MNAPATAAHSPPSLIQRFAARYAVEPSKLMNTLKATAFRVKDGEATNEQMMALLVVADQYKLNPFTKEIYAYPDKQNGIVPVVSVDGWTRIVNEHPQFDGVDFEYGPTVPVSTHPGQKQFGHEWVKTLIYRKDRGRPICTTEYLDEVYRPPFTGKGKDGNPYVKEGPWQTHLKRMHRHKSWIQCARLAFGFAGIYDEDEAQRIVDMGPAEVVERSPLTSQVKRKSEALPSPQENGQDSSMPETAAPKLEDLLADLIQAESDERIDYLSSIAKEHLNESALTAFMRAAASRMEEISEGGNE